MILLRTIELDVLGLVKSDEIDFSGLHLVPLELYVDGGRMQNKLFGLLVLLKLLVAIKEGLSLVAGFLEHFV